MKITQISKPRIKDGTVSISHTTKLDEFFLNMLSNTGSGQSKISA